jgi:hypothetical protein
MYHDTACAGPPQLLGPVSHAGNQGHWIGRQVRNVGASGVVVCGATEAVIHYVSSVRFRGGGGNKGVNRWPDAQADALRDMHGGNHCGDRPGGDI